MHRLEKFPPTRYLFAFVRILVREGVAAVWKASARKLTVLLYRLPRPGEKAEEDARSAAHAGSPTVIACPLLDWNIPLFQRPQQIAMHLARSGCRYYYCTVNRSCDSVWGYEELARGLYLTNRFERLMASRGRRVLHIYSTDLDVEWALIAKELESGNIILYEYIDEIHPQIPRVPIPERVRVRHENILKEERCIVIATADKLYRNVLRHRSRNCALVTNGVDYEHFSRPFPHHVTTRFRSISLSSPDGRGGPRSASRDRKASVAVCLPTVGSARRLRSRRRRCRTEPSISAQERKGTDCDGTFGRQLVFPAFPDISRAFTGTDARCGRV